MAAPTDFIGISAFGDELITAQISAQYQLLLADRNALPNHPALMYVGDVRGAGASTIKLSQLGLLGYNLLGTTTEGDPVANTALTDSSSTVQVVQYTKVYEPSDLAKMLDKQGVLKPEFLAVDAMISGSNTMRSLVANVTDDFTATVTTSGVDCSFATLLDGITTLEVAKVEGPFLGLLHPVQWGDVRKDVASSSGGAIQFHQGSSQLLIDGMKALGLKGSWLGVDWFTTTDVPTANSGADRAGGIFGRGAVLWADGTQVVEDSTNQMLVGDKVLFERQRVAAGGTTKYASHRYLGVAIGQNACGVSIITDA